MTILLGLCMSIKVPKPPLIRSMAAFMGCALACELVRLCMEMLIQERSTRVVIVGCDRLAAKAWREFRVHRNRRMEVVGFVNQCAPDELMPDIASRRLGGLDALPRIVMDRNIDDVIIATDIGSPSQLLEQSVAGAATLGTRILCLKDICGIYRGHMIREYGDNLFELAPAPRLGGFRQALKRLFDVTISTIVLVFGLSLVLPLAVFSLLRGRSIAYQSQLQLGFRRRKYRRWRLNSAPRDRRVRLFLELLSSMWNVFCGDMSLVGPPPVSEAQAAQADIAALAGRFSVRPGLIRSHMDDSDSALVSPTSDSLNWSLRMDVKTLTRAFRLGMERSAVIETEAGAS
jgi:lipopolysaccharide/colanic/teichoic acid biosynthesis glycosyltransferase